MKRWFVWPGWPHKMRNADSVRHQDARNGIQTSVGTEAAMVACPEKEKQARDAAGREDKKGNLLSCKWRIAPREAPTPAAPHQLRAAQHKRFLVALIVLDACFSPLSPFLRALTHRLSSLILKYVCSKRHRSQRPHSVSRQWRLLAWECRGSRCTARWVTLYLPLSPFTLLPCSPISVLSDIIVN